MIERFLLTFEVWFKVIKCMILKLNRKYSKAPYYATPGRHNDYIIMYVRSIICYTSPGWGLLFSL